jgi:hypothetical protein
VITTGNKTVSVSPTATEGAEGMVQQHGARNINLRSWSGNGAKASNPLLQQALSGLAQVRANIINERNTNERTHEVTE